MKKLYAAYGSNLNIEQMDYRCPAAKICGKGIIKDYRLLFKGMTDSAYLTIEPSQGKKVPVLVWEIGPEDEKALDRYEGHPNFYYKKDIPVKLETGEMVTAMVYIMTDKIKDRTDLNLPSRMYWEIVLGGYQSAGFDPDFLGEAFDISTEAADGR